MAILQTTLLPYLSINGIKPDLLLVLVAIWSLLNGSREGSLWALVGGFILDLLSGAPFGIGTLSLVAVSLLGGLRQVRAIHASYFLPIFVAVASLVHDGIFLTLMQLSGQPVTWMDSLLRSTLLGTALNVGAAFLVYPLLRRLASQSQAIESPW